MRIILISLILLFGFSFSYAQHTSDVEVNKKNYTRPSPMTFGIYGYGYIPTGLDKDIIGNGGGGGFKVTYNINKYFGIGLSTGLTVAASDNYNNNLTLLSDSRFFLIVQRETAHLQKGIVPWGSVGFGILAATASYGNYYQIEEAVGFNVVFSAGLRYNFRKAYLGFGAEYSLSKVYGEQIQRYYNDVYYYYYDISRSVTMDPSGVNIFAEFGYRF